MSRGCISEEEQLALFIEFDFDGHANQILLKLSFIVIIAISSSTQDNIISQNVWWILLALI
jgi:hypothetical protein